MAEPTPDTPAAAAPEALSERHQDALRQFILLWGEMATHWGINRTMAQIHALLYASERPLDTDEIMERLQISRGNANMNLRSLVDWQLVKKTHQIGSRKDYYTAEKDVWRISARVIEERQRREIKPVQDALADTVTTLRAAEDLSPAEAQFAERIEGLTAFMEVFDGVAEALLPFLHERNAGKIRRIAQFAAKLRRGEDA